MFSEWTDPYDIDNYYNDLNDAFKEFQSAPSASMYQRMPSTGSVIHSQVEMKPEEPTGVIINSVVDKKNGFEVRPDSTFLDGHPVGKQPSYNILRSGPKEPYCNNNGGGYPDIYWFCAIVFVMILLFTYQMNKMKCRLMEANITIQMLKMMRCDDIERNRVAR